jgi:hypothetical protein
LRVCASSFCSKLVEAGAVVMEGQAAAAAAAAE